MAVTWTRVKPREPKKGDRPAYKLPQDYDSISEYLADRYPPTPQAPKPALPRFANVAHAHLKRH